MSAAIDFEDDFVLVNFDDYSNEDSSTKTTTKEIEGEIISISKSSTTEEETSNVQPVTPSTSPAKPQSRKTKGRPRSSSTSSEEEALKEVQEIERQRVKKIMEQKKMSGKKKKKNSTTIDYALSCAQAELKAAKGGKKVKNDVTWGR